MYNKANHSITDALSKECRRCFSYCPASGEVRWKQKLSSLSRAQVGGLVGVPARGGALKVNFLGATLLVHRLAWFLHYDEWPTKFVDHINGNANDNRLCNLRLATRQQNRANARNSKNSTSKYLGVFFNKACNKWSASIGDNRQYLGLFDSEEEAMQAYKQKALELYGEFTSYDR